MSHNPLSPRFVLSFYEYKYPFESESFVDEEVRFTIHFSWIYDVFQDGETNYKERIPEVLTDFKDYDEANEMARNHGFDCIEDYLFERQDCKMFGIIKEYFELLDMGIEHSFRHLYKELCNIGRRAI